MPPRRAPRSQAPRTSLRFRLGVSLAVLFAVLAGLEGAARWLDPVAPGWYGDAGGGVVMTGHPTRLWGLAPGRRMAAGAVATINEQGLRGEAPTGPPAGPRILVLGDSSFFGHGLPDHATLPAQLPAALAALGVQAEAFNGAVPGYSTEQSRLLLEEVGWGYAPTLLLVGNLWSDNNLDAFRDIDLLATRRASQAGWWSASAALRLLATQADRMRGGQGARLVTWTRDSRWPSVQSRRVPLQDYARNLDAMVQEASKRGVGVAFIAPANRAMVEGGLPPRAAWDPYFEAQAALAAWHGLPVVQAKMALQATGAAPESLFVDVMHPSALGAQALAAESARVLTAAGWPTSPLLGKAAAFDVSQLDDADGRRIGGGPGEYTIQSKLFPTGSAPATKP